MPKGNGDANPLTKSLYNVDASGRERGKCRKAMETNCLTLSFNAKQRIVGNGVNAERQWRLNGLGYHISAIINPSGTG